MSEEPSKRPRSAKQQRHGELWQQMGAQRSVLRNLEWAALQRGTGPLKHPRSEYVTVTQAAQIKNCSEKWIKSRIYYNVLTAEKPSRTGELLIHRPHLGATVVRRTGK